MLLAIREYFRREKVASNQQLAREFSLDLTALQPMLDLWIQRGSIEICQKPIACKSPCGKCSRQAVVYYRYCQENSFSTG